MSSRIIPAALMIVGALLLTALVPTAAAAHAGHMHPAPQNATAAVVAKDATTSDAATRHAGVAELSVQDFVPGGIASPQSCGGAGCCSNGHCSSCSTALEPASTAQFGRSAAALLASRNVAPPSALAYEGPPRPPKSFA